MRKEDTHEPMRPEETVSLIEDYRLFFDLKHDDVAQENDTYSLAQPSPFRYVPTIASTRTAPIRGKA